MRPDETPAPCHGRASDWAGWAGWLGWPRLGWLALAGNFINYIFPLAAWAGLSRRLGWLRWLAGLAWPGWGWLPGLAGLPGPVFHAVP